VGATWVTDLEQYNEWMTEEDYEVDEGGHKKIHKVGGAD
jgi:SWI/SNF related-matrix-associated actin-dependent regulator of chromatin subfamily C